MRTRGEERNVTCFNDCRQEGCPGHVIRTDYYSTSDIIEVFLDGKVEYRFDPNQWKAAFRSAWAWGPGWMKWDEPPPEKGNEP